MNEEKRQHKRDQTWQRHASNRRAVVNPVVERAARIGHPTPSARSLEAKVVPRESLNRGSGRNPLAERRHAKN